MRSLPLAAVAAALVGCGGADRPDPPARVQARHAQRAVGYRLYWVGASFDGLALEDVLRGPVRTSFAYGTCDASGSDTGCAPPLEIQVSSICNTNALVLDIRPAARRRARGTTVLDYGEAGRLELDAGTSHVTISSSPARSRRAIAGLRRVAGSQRIARALPAPRFPREYVQELRRVSSAYARLRDVHAVRTALGISKSAVRFRLGLARDLGAKRLRRRRGWTRAEGCLVEPSRAISR
jgi:hypothetical protein